jgi:hypothetical protein
VILVDQPARARLESWKTSLVEATRPLVDLDGATSVALPDVDAVRLLFALAGGGAFELVGQGAEWSFEAGRLRSALPADELARRTVALRRAHRASRQDRGAHALYLGLGTLAWRDAGGASRTAPLWLQPVELERDGGALRLVADRLAPELNTALVDALRRDHGLALDVTLDLAALLEAAAGAAVTRDGWQVSRGSVLAVLPVAELALARDVAALELPRGAVGHLLAAPAPAHAAAGPGPAAPDILAPLDADADQLAAIAAASTATGAIVVHAPAGTGATQTIANLIAHCASQGRSLLVVSDRVAALDAVRRRLATVGLDELVLALHDDTTDHVAALARVLERPFRPVAGVNVDDARLAALRAELDGFAGALHAVGPFGRSLHDVLGRLVELRSTPRAELAETDTPAIDRATYERRVTAVVALAQAALPVEPVASHPWRRSSLAACASAGLDRACAALVASSRACDELAAAAAEVTALVPGALARTPQQLVALGAFAQLAAASPRPGAELVSQMRAGREPDVGETVALIRARGGGSVEVPRDPAAFVAIAARHRVLAREVDDVFTSAVDRLAAPELWAQLRRWTGRVAPLRYMALRAARAEVEAAAMPGALATDDAAIAALEAVIAERACRAALEAAAEPAKRWFGELCGDPLAVDLTKVDAAVAWAGELRRAFDDVAIPESARPAAWRAVVAHVAAGSRRDGAPTDDRDELAPFARLAAAVATWEPALVELAAATGVRHDELGAGADHLAALRDQLDGFETAVDALPAWATFHAAREFARAAGVDLAIAAIERGDLGAPELAGAWERAALLAWADAEHAATPALAGFHGTAFDAHVAAFADLDRGALALARARAVVGVAERVPRLPRWTPPHADADLDPMVVQGHALLAAARGTSARDTTARTAMSRATSDATARTSLSGATAARDARDRAPLRDTLAAIPALLPRLAPAVLGTPAAVARHLDPALRFDLVVIDEASHLPTAHALGALARGDVAVLVGDAKQGDGVLADALAAGAAERRLTWQHRARHDELVAPVNARFYDDRLVVLPAPHGSPDLGVTWREADAAAVAADVVARLRDPAQRTRSLAVIALTRAHATAIEDLLDAARLADPALDAAFEPDAAADVAEPVVVRHVDAAAGLTRDVVILHAAADAGERQLAVALTRAREQLVVASPDEAHPIARELAAARAARDGAAAGPIAAAIARALGDRGWTLRHAVGAGPYRIELAVVDPSEPAGGDRFVLAIETDGAVYATGAGARDRDRLRAQELAALGWRMHRVWTIDWWLDPEREIQRAHGAIVAAIAASRQRRAPARPRAPRQTMSTGRALARPSSPPPVAGSAPAAPRTATATRPPAAPFAAGSGPTAAALAEAALTADATPALVDNAPTSPVHLERGAIAIGPYTAAAIPAGRRSPDDLFSPRHLPELGKVVEQVLAAEAPVHIDLLARRVGAYFGIGRVTQRVIDQVRVALAGRGRWGEETGVVWRLDQDPTAVPAVRVAGSGPEARRDITEVPLSELAAAARIVVERAALGDRAVGTTELVRDAARLLGFARLTERVVDRIARGVRLAELRELIAIDDGKARLRQARPQ